MTEAPEPEDKLDAATTVVANGPEDAPFDWHAIDWRRIEDDVRRLRQRIFTGLLEPGAVKAARRVLRGAGHSNVAGLPDRGAAAPSPKHVDGATAPGQRRPPDPRRRPGPNW